MYYNRIHAPVQQKPRIYAGKSLFLWKNSFCSACGGSHHCNSVALRRQPPLPSPWGRWRGAALCRTVTDEGSPPSAGLIAAHTFVILWLAAAAALAFLLRGRRGRCRAVHRFTATQTLHSKALKSRPKPHFANGKIKKYEFFINPLDKGTKRYII